MTKISELLGVRERKFKRDGSRWQELVGVELELENVTSTSIPYWEAKADNSLRNGVEYVMAQPYAGPTLEAALDAFYDEKLKFNNSARCSTHIHLNMTDATLDCVRSMTMIMYMIEDGLFNIIGEGRKWAGYSMALSEMDPVRLRMAMSHSDPHTLLNNLAPTRNQDRYYGFNTASLRKHGTVEFRYFPGGPTRAELESWIDLICAVKAAGMTHTPQDLMNRLNFSSDVVHFLTDILPSFWTNALLTNMSASVMLDKFAQIAAVTADPDVVEHKDNLVFLTPTFLSYVKKHVVKKAGGEYLDLVAAQVKVVNGTDWFVYLDAARAHDNEKPASPKSKTSKVKVETYAQAVSFSELARTATASYASPSDLFSEDTWAATPTPPSRDNPFSIPTPR